MTEWHVTPSGAYVITLSRSHYLEASRRIGALTRDELIEWAQNYGRARYAGRSAVARLTDDPNDPELTHGADDAPSPQARAYLVLSEAERAAGFVRPLRRSYQHTICGSVTTMSDPLAETYARRPDFYGATYCVACGMHRSVSEFVWVDGHGQPTDDVVGS